MMDYHAVVASARERLAEIDRERDHLLKFISHAEALAGLETSGEATTKEMDKPRRRPSPAMAPTRKAAADALKERGEPMPTRELLRYVLSKGVEIGGKDQVATLSARMSNSREFKNHRNIGWWFSDRPLPSGFTELDEAEDQSVEGQPSASNPETKGGEHDATALTPEYLGQT